VSRTIANRQSEGGVGKTTTAINLGAALRVRSDASWWWMPIRRATRHEGSESVPDPERLSIYDTLMDGDNPIQGIIHTEFAPRSPSRRAGSAWRRNRAGFGDGSGEEATACPRGVKENYDFILIDCPPSLGPFTLNTLVAADSLLIPVQCELPGPRGAQRGHGHTPADLERSQPRPHAGGVVLTMFDDRTNLSRQVPGRAPAASGESRAQDGHPRNIALGRRRASASRSSPTTSVRREPRRI